MFVRRLKSKSGKIYIQVIDKSSGKYKVLNNLGSSNNETEIKELEKQAKIWINNKLGINEFDFANSQQQVQAFFDSITQLKLAGLDLLLGKIFDEIGFDKITEEIFKHLVIYRLFYPTSKLKTNLKLFS